MSTAKRIVSGFFRTILDKDYLPRLTWINLAVTLVAFVVMVWLGGHLLGWGMYTASTGKIPEPWRTTLSANSTAVDREKVWQVFAGNEIQSLGGYTPMLGIGPENQDYTGN